MRPATTISGCAAVALALSMSGEALAGAHTWRVSEIFSSADGQIQFVELVEINGGNGEVMAGTHHITTLANDQLYTGNLTPPTGFHHLLFGTDAYNALPGAPPRDRSIPANFFAVAGPDTVTYVPYDSVSYIAGGLPTDGVTSLDTNGLPVANSPTNYAGTTGSIDASPPCPSDINKDGTVGINDLLDLLAGWGSPYTINDLLDLLGDWGSC